MHPGCSWHRQSYAAAKSRSALGGPGGQLIKCLSGFLFIGSAGEDLAAINFYDHEWIRICLAKVKY